MTGWPSAGTLVLALTFTGPWAVAASPQGPVAAGPAPAVARTRPLPGNLTAFFIENQGQMDRRVSHFFAGRAGVYFTATGLTYSFTRPARSPLPGGSSATIPAIQTRARELPDPADARRWVVAVDLEGARGSLWPEGANPTPTRVSYFKGPQTSWKSNVSTYSSVVYRDVWPGIDLAYDLAAGELKYTFTVHPGGDPTDIRLRYRGARSMSVAPTGDLNVETGLGGIHDSPPIAYQEQDGCRQPVKARHRLRRDGEDWIASFQLGPYDATRPMVLDPVVFIYAGFIGGDDDEVTLDVNVNASGEAYVTGYTQSTDATFPVTVGPDTTYNGGVADAFVGKVNASGSALISLGYIGGDDFDWGASVGLDPGGNVYVCGITGSSPASFPALVGPYLSYGGNWDGFIAKLTPAMTALVYAGYVGGARRDECHRLAVDAGGNAYMTGRTESDETTFPVAVGPELTYNYQFGAYVAKVWADGSGLAYAGYIGRGPQVSSQGIAVDGAGSAYVAGVVWRNINPRVGPDLTYNGDPQDAFVAKLRPDGTDWEYAGYIGGAALDAGYGLAVNAAGEAFVTGSTASLETSFPIRVGPDLSHNGNSDAFVAKVRADGTALEYAGYIGGVGRDNGRAIAVDSDDNVFVAGSIESSTSGFPLRLGPDLTFNPDRDGFVAEVRSDWTTLVYAGLIGGDDDDNTAGIAVDPGGSAYVVGYTWDTGATFPRVVGPDLVSNGGLVDAFVVKVSAPDCSEAAAPVRRLLAVKDPANRDDLALSWTPQRVANGYNLWYVTDASDIPRARQSSSPPAVPVAGCNPLNPALTNACTDQGGVSRPTSWHFFYQVRAWCDAALEGP